MAKRATANKTAAKAAAKKTAAAPATTLSPGVLSSLPVETPPEVLGVSPPAAPLSGAEVVVVTDAAGDTYAEGDIPPEIVVGSEAVIVSDELPIIEPAAEATLSPEARAEAMAPALAWLDELKKEQGAEDAPKFDGTHPAIALAQSFQSGSGAPDEGEARFHLPEPPDVRSKAQR